jgi:hypothetical protein
MRKKLVIIQLCLLILSVYLLAPFVKNPNPNRTSSLLENERGFSQAPLSSPLPTTVRAEESERIDSFNVHPANRWTESINGMTADLYRGLLRLQDTGDGSVDEYRMARELAQLDGKIVIKFEVSSASSDYQTDYLAFELIQSDDRNKKLGIIIRHDANNDYLTTYLQWRDWDGSTYRTKTLSGDERVFDDVWYVFTLEYDVMKEEFEMVMKFENGTSVFKYDQSDLSYRPYIYQTEDLSLMIRQTSQYNGKVVTSYLAYAKAPYREKRWSQSDTPSDPQWVEDEWDYTYVSGSVAVDTSAWDLVVPYLDSFSATLRLNVTASGLGNGDYAGLSFSLFTVDYDDGALTEAMQIWLTIEKSVGGTLLSKADLEIDGSSADTATDFSTYSSNEIARLDFSCSVHTDRQKISVGARFWPDESSSTYYDIEGVCRLSDVSIDFSNEFLLRTGYSTFGWATDEWTAYIDDFGFISKSIFEDFVMPVIAGIQAFLAEIWVTVGRFLAVINTAVGIVIVKALEELQPFLTAIQSAINQIETWIAPIENWIDSAIATIEPFFDPIETWLNNVADAIGVFIEDVWTHFAAAANDFMAAVVSALSPLLSDLADIFGGILELVFPILETFIDVIIGFFATGFFWLYDNLPLWSVLGISPIDFLAIFSGDTIKNILTSIGYFLTNWSSFIEIVFDWIFFGGTYAVLLYWFWVIFLGFASQKFDAASGLAEVIERLWKGPDIVLLGFGPFHVPVGYLIGIPLLGFIIFADAGVFFWIW